MNRKVKSLKQTVFLLEQCTVSKVITSVEVQSFPTVVLPLVYCPADDDTLLQVSPEIHCPGVSSRYCCYSNHAAGSKPI